MKNVIIAFSLLISSTTLFSQDKSYIITNEAQVRDINLYISAIENTNWDKYRLINERTIITFQKGVKIELLSADEMTEKGLEVDLTKILKEKPTHLYKPTFVLGKNGYIIEQHSYIEKSTK